jgi:hypothetical protein
MDHFSQTGRSAPHGYVRKLGDRIAFQARSMARMAQL